MGTDQEALIPGTSLGIAELIPLLQGDVRGLLLYGSRARGTASPESDVDILQLSNSSGPTLHTGLLAVSRYDAFSLRGLMTRGSIFGRHLRNEGVLLWDPHDELRTILGQFTEPSSYDRTLRLIRLIGQTLALPHDAKYDRGVHRAAIYGARTALYIASIQAGNEHFDTSRIALKFNFDRFDDARKAPDEWALTYLLDMSQALTSSVPEDDFILAPDFDSAVTQLATRYPDASQFLASLLTVGEDLPYSTLSLPFA
jgi:predicted nucleotidyltransferase